MSLEAKDLYAAMDFIKPNKTGYDVRTRTGDLKLSLFRNSLDWSLDSIKLQEEHYKATRKKDFFFIKDQKKYTQAVINVTFSYSYKEFNQVGTNIFIRAGYDFKDCEFVDGVFLQDEKLIAIQTDIMILSPISETMLGDYFTYDEGCYKVSKEIKVLKNRAELRQELYQNGFVCDGIKYVRYKRSSGSSRLGKCLFINELLAKRMRRWDNCGLTIKENAPIDLAAWEAYIALPMSSIIDTVNIPLNSILIVDDEESVFEEEVIAVEECAGHLEASKRKGVIKNIIWDGESLMDESLFGNYKSKGMLLLRNRFFKTCAFNTNIQQWFSDNNVTDVKQLNGFTLAEDITQVKFITTPSSIKYLRFGTIEQWLANIDSTFGIVKFEKETDYFDGRMVQCHYQLINTLDFKEHEIKEFLKDSLSYISMVRKDPDMLRYHIGFSFKAVDGENMINAYKTKNDIVFKILGINNKFSKTKLYKDFRDTVVKGYMKNLKRGHILVEGNYSTLFGNGFELLNQAIGKFNGESVIPAECIHSKRFDYDKTLLGARSPHICAGNILLVKNVDNELIEKYFNLTKEIVYINSIKSNIFQKLNGADLDSDTILLTDDQILINVAKRSEGKFLVPTNFVQAKKKQRYYNDDNKADLDIKTSVNKIGEIINLSQLLNSIYWEKNNKKEWGGLEELYLDICKLSVLSNIEIDKAKKEFTINSTKELDLLKAKYRMEEDGKQVKPFFFKIIAIENGYAINDKTEYRYFSTPMDYYLKAINSFNFRMSRSRKDELIPFMDIIKPIDISARSGYYLQLRDKIIDIMVQVKKAITKIYLGYDQLDFTDRFLARIQAALLKRQYIRIVDNLSKHTYLTYLVLKELDNKKYRSLHNLMFEILFGEPNETFMKMINESKEDMTKIIEIEGGEILLFNKQFSKVLA